MNKAKRYKIVGAVMVLAFGFGAWNNFQGEHMESTAAGYISIVLLAAGIYTLVKGFRMTKNETSTSNEKLQ